jgi:hypothetical protein
MTWERVTAGQVREGDEIAETRDKLKLRKIIEFGPAGDSSRYIRTTRGRLRPRYSTRLWRWTEPSEDVEDVELELFDFPVVVGAPTREQAEKVISERVGYDEDLGFPYTIERGD